MKELIWVTFRSTDEGLSKDHQLWQMGTTEEHVSPPSPQRLTALSSQKRIGSHDLHVQWRNVDWPSLFQHLCRLSRLRRVQEFNSQVMLEIYCPPHCASSGSDNLFDLISRWSLNLGGTSMIQTPYLCLSILQLLQFYTLTSCWFQYCLPCTRKVL